MEDKKIVKALKQKEKQLKELLTMELIITRIQDYYERVNYCCKKIRTEEPKNVTNLDEYEKQLHREKIEWIYKALDKCNEDYVLNLWV